MDVQAERIIPPATSVTVTEASQTQSVRSPYACKAVGN